MKYEAALWAIRFIAPCLTIAIGSATFFMARNSYESFTMRHYEMCVRESIFALTGLGFTVGAAVISIALWTMNP